MTEFFDTDAIRAALAFGNIQCLCNVCERVHVLPSSQTCSVLSDPTLRLCVFRRIADALTPVHDFCNSHIRTAKMHLSACTYALGDAWAMLVDESAFVSFVDTLRATRWLEEQLWRIYQCIDLPGLLCTMVSYFGSSDIQSVDVALRSLFGQTLWDCYLPMHLIRPDAQTAAWVVAVSPNQADRQIRVAYAQGFSAINCGEQMDAAIKVICDTLPLLLLEPGSSDFRQRIRVIDSIAENWLPLRTTVDAMEVALTSSAQISTRSGENDSKRASSLQATHLDL